MKYIKRSTFVLGVVSIVAALSAGICLIWTPEAEAEPVTKWIITLFLAGITFLFITGIMEVTE